MTDPFESFQPLTRPTAEEPLRGLTVLVVEDSRCASEALRLMCLRSGARIRRADCLASARRHLSTYRPSVTIVDLGLPDGSGLDLLRRLDTHQPRLPVLLATSGDPTLVPAARAAGAQGFLSKPMASLAAFQGTVIAALPRYARPPSPLPADAVISPDPMALREDLALADHALAGPGAVARLDYIAQFLAGVGRSALDRDLEEAAAGLRGLPPAEAARRVAAVRHLVSARLRSGA